MRLKEKAKAHKSGNEKTEGMTLGFLYLAEYLINIIRRNRSWSFNCNRIWPDQFTELCLLRWNESDKQDDEQKFLMGDENNNETFEEGKF